jgi:hypothetical protein
MFLKTHNIKYYRKLKKLKRTLSFT